VIIYSLKIPIKLVLINDLLNGTFPNIIQLINAIFQLSEILSIKIPDAADTTSGN